MADHISIRRCEPADACALALLGQATFLQTFAGILDGASILAHCESQHATRVYEAWLHDSTTPAWIAKTKIGHAPISYLVLANPRCRLPICMSMILKSNVFICCIVFMAAASAND